MSDFESQSTQRVVRPALKPFVRPVAGSPRPELRPAPIISGRATLPPFSPIKFGGAKPGASPAPAAVIEDDETPSWSPPPAAEVAEMAEPAVEAPSNEAFDASYESENAPFAYETFEQHSVAPVAESVHGAVVAGEPEAYGDPEPYVESEFAASDFMASTTDVVSAEMISEPELVAEPTAEAEPVVRMPLLEADADTADADTADAGTIEAVEEEEAEALLPPFERIGPTDPTPVLNRRITPAWQLNAEPHRMTPMRVTPMRPTMAVTPHVAAALNLDERSANRAVAQSLETVAAQVRRGDLIVTAAVPIGDDPQSLAAGLAAALAALLGARG